MKKFVKSFFFILLVLGLLFNTSIADNVSDDAKIVVNSFQSLSVDDLEYIKKNVDKEIEKRYQKKSDSKKVNIFGKWLGNYFVDKFNEPTKQKYITYTNKINGTFSNSVVNSKELSVKIIISIDDLLVYKDTNISFELMEYGEYKINEGQYRCEVRSGNDYVSMLSRMSGRLKLTGSDKEIEELVDIFKNNNPVKFYIYGLRSEYNSSKYSFTVEDTTGFEDAFAWLNE